jgi:hypothetical protein
MRGRCIRLAPVVVDISSRGRFAKMKCTLRRPEEAAFICLAISHSYFSDPNGPMEVHTEEWRTMYLVVIPISHLSDECL